ncbi:MAG: cadmium-translocating P-type ATPase [Planctomycetes bacterium]|nr:cadmium-translocating P-type ATPase [Planctomycetota bacterium]
MEIAALEKTQLSLCSHCGLPVAGSGHQGEVAGAWQRFCCYGCFLCQKIIGEKGVRGLSSWLLAQLGLSWFFAMDIMMLSLMRYFGGFEGIELGTVRILEWIEFALATAIIMLLGFPYLWRSLQSLFRGSVSADALIAIGAFATYGYSTWSLITQDRPDLYFDSGSMILVLVNLGRYVEAAARRRTIAGVKALSALDLSQSRRLKPDGGVEEVAASALVPGDRVLIEPGGALPADGVIERGQSSIPEALLTGEERAVPKRPGDSVLAGTVNGDSELVVRVTAVGEKTLRARIFEMTRDALLRRTRFESVVDKLARVFIPLVILFAVGTWLVWEFALHKPTQGAFAALAVLLVACPCALGLAVPLASALALGRAAQLGILIRDGGTLERLAHARHVLLDKTGTLTFGRPDVKAVQPQAGIDEQHLLRVAAAVESKSEHGLGKAIVRHWRGGALPAVENFRAVPGCGVEGKVEGKLIRLGTAEFCGVAAGEESQASVAYVVEDGRPLGRILLEDRIKPSARDAIAQLHDLGLDVALVTGDHEAAAQRVARETGIFTVRSRHTPEQKLAAVNALGAPTVIMTGDGFNDGPALMAAGVGVSFAEATGLARLSAGLTLLGEDLTRLPLAVRLARRTLVVMKLNLFWAFIYNLGALGVAAAGFLAPQWAAVAMVISSLCVVGNSWQLREFERKFEHEEVLGGEAIERTA